MRNNCFFTVALTEFRAWLSQFTLSGEQNDTFYGVNRDGRLALDREGLLKSGRMNRQFEAARRLAGK